MPLQTPGRFLGSVLGPHGSARSFPDLLINDGWHGARIDDLVRVELASFGVLDRVQISAKGPAIVLNPEGARNIALALHKLATNASKYGALSVPEGKVADALGARE
jgi:two-component sensor histidine kinase